VFLNRPARPAARLFAVQAFRIEAGLGLRPPSDFAAWPLRNTVRDVIFGCNIFIIGDLFIFIVFYYSFREF